MVMGEETSLLMDGELDESRLDSVFRELKQGEARQDWNCYHLIGDYLRQPDAARLSSAFANGEFMSRVAAGLADEPTVIAPRPQRINSAFLGWAIAASVAAVGFVGWFGLQEFGSDDQPSVIRIASDARNAEIKRLSHVNDYVAVHQQYAPAMGMEKLRPYIRSAGSPQDLPQ